MSSVPSTRVSLCGTQRSLLYSSLIIGEDCRDYSFDQLWGIHWWKCQRWESPQLREASSFVISKMQLVNPDKYPLNIRELNVKKYIFIETVTKISTEVSTSSSCNINHERHQTNRDGAWCYDSVWTLSSVNKGSLKRNWFFHWICIRYLSVLRWRKHLQNTVVNQICSNNETAVDIGNGRSEEST